jgi:hypothetical protein
MIMPNIATAALAVTLLAASGTTSRTFDTGNSLYDFCKSGSQACAGYVSGVADVMGLTEISGFKACIPLDVTRRQATDVVTKWLAANPAKRNSGAPGLVAHALADAFPCH